MTPVQIAAVDCAMAVGRGIEHDYPAVHTLVAIYQDDVAVQFWQEAGKMAAVGARLTDLADNDGVAKRFVAVDKAIRQHLNEQKVPVLS